MPAPYSPMKIFVMVPTYNERENISQLIEKIHFYCPELNVLVVDDNSPDETWKLVQEISEKNPRVHLLHRTTNRGRGISGICGFLQALRLGADAVIEMDADFSHDPAYLPKFVAAIREFDLVQGSRFVQGGKDADRGWIRQMITGFANAYIRVVLGIKLRDCSSGYRCYRREVLENLGLENMVSTGPSIVQECLLRAIQLGFSIIEIPIVFIDRRRGQTKLTYRHLLNGFLMVLRLKMTKPFRSSTEAPALTAR